MRSFSRAAPLLLLGGVWLVGCTPSEAPPKKNASATPQPSAAAASGNQVLIDVPDMH